MYNKSQINELHHLKETNPDIYQLLMTVSSNDKKTLQKGCHDLLNIVSLIKGNYQLLEFKNPDLKDNRHFQNIGRDIEMLIDAFAAIKTYRESDIIHTKPSDIFQIINSAIQKSLCENINLIEPTPLPGIETDVSKIEYVLLSILNNVSDIDPKTSVTIATSITNNELQIRISDTLPKLEASVADRLFEPFNTNKTSHIGLSLASSKQILIAHNGDLEYTKSTDGNTFILHLPL